jgi:hypothetical protein
VVGRATDTLVPSVEEALAEALDALFLSAAEEDPDKVHAIRRQPATRLQ